MVWTLYNRLEDERAEISWNGSEGVAAVTSRTPQDNSEELNLPQYFCCKPVQSCPGPVSFTEGITSVAAPPVLLSRLDSPGWREAEEFYHKVPSSSVQINAAIAL